MQRIHNRPRDLLAHVKVESRQSRLDFMTQPDCLLSKRDVRSHSGQRIF